ncbi:MAG: gliding motility-associated lipoprotein [Bacteroidia bacterium]|nr:MAG: gliding motility-associated lipoprotein [Bacteroidia bacterium]
MKKIFLIALAAVLFTSCNWLGRGDRGHLVGVQNRPDAFYADPPGMVFIPMGSVTLGPSDQDIAYTQNARSWTVSLPAFYMDETEITNNQYRQFVYWVRDSLARSILAATLDPDFEIDEDEFGEPLIPPLLNWRPQIRWGGEEERVVLEELYLPEQERFFRRREIDTRLLVYRYFTIDLRRAANIEPNERRNLNRADLITQHETHIYPDTLVWISDFTYSYNEPMAKQYFWHPSFDHYPVVGVNWVQARAFNVWRTQYLNSYLASRNQPFAMDFELPSEAQWEYAARGGLDLNPYPWGGPYLRDQEGCFLANFKPMRGRYADTGAMYTNIAGFYPPNDYGLYDMAGNVSEWTRNAYDESFYYFGHDLSPDYQYEFNPDVDPPALSRKVVRGGSWKDIGYFLQVSTRSYEFQDTATSYIGFRSVQTFPGRDRDDGRRGASNVY